MKNHIKPKKRAPYALLAALWSPAAFGQPTVPAVPPPRECPVAQPYCNNEWEAKGPNGERYWMVRWSKKTPADILVLRIPLAFVDPIARINCSAFSKDFPQPSCQQTFAMSLLLRALLPDLDPYPDNRILNNKESRKKVHISIVSPAAGSQQKDAGDIFLDLLHLQLSAALNGRAREFELSYRDRRFGLEMVGVPRSSGGQRVIGLKDVYFDGKSISSSENVISCTYENSSLPRSYCEQKFISHSLNSIVSVSYDGEFLPDWKVIRSKIEKFIGSTLPSD